MTPTIPRRRILWFLALSHVLVAGLAQLAWTPWRTAGAAVKPAPAVAVTEEERLIAVVGKASPAVVSILVEKPAAETVRIEIDAQGAHQEKIEPGGFEEIGRGTGFLVSEAGMIVTNRHVAGDRLARYTVLTSDERKFDARILDIDPVNDLALLKIEARGLPTLALEADDRVRIGQTVVAIGNALGKYANTVTRGILSGVGRSIEASNRTTGAFERLEDILQTDAAINEGNSGGPLLNLDGKVIGVNTAIEIGAEGLGFAIPVSEVRKVLSSYARYGAIARPRLGVRYLTITPELRLEMNLTQAYGALIDPGDEGEAAVLPDSPASAAGLRVGDIIVEVDGRKLEGKLNLARAIQALNVGDVARLTVLRGAETLTLNVRLDAHPPY